MPFGLAGFVTLRYVQAHPMRTVLAALGVAVGVGLFLAIEIINDSTLAFFRDNVEAVGGRASLTILSDEAGFPEEVLDVVKGIGGVEDAASVVESEARLVDHETGARGKAIEIFGIDMLQDSSARLYGGNVDGVVEDAVKFIARLDSVLVARRFATDHHLSMGSRFDALTAHGIASFVVRGILPDNALSRAYGSSVGVMDVYAAQRAFGKEGRIDRVDVAAAPGAKLDVLADAIRQRLGPGYRVEPPDTQLSGLAHMIEPYQHVMLLMSSCALVIGIVVMANAVGFAMAERRRDIGLLRAVGADRWTVIALFLAEAAMVGFVGGCFGLAIGRAVAEWLVGLVSRSMSAQYVVPINVTSIHMTGARALAGIACGTACAVVAAVRPVVRASRVEIVDALLPREVGSSGEPAGIQHRRGVVGLLLLGSLLVGVNLVGSPRFGWLAYVNPVFAAVGSWLAGPWLAMCALSRGRRLLSPKESAGRWVAPLLACDGLLRNKRRTATSLLGMMVALIFIILVSSIQRSFKEAVRDWETKTLQYDIIVSSVGRLISADIQPLHESVGAEIRRLPGVEGVSAMRFVRINYEGQRVAVKAVECEPTRAGAAFFDTIDKPAREAQELLLREATPTALVSRSFAERFHKHTGDPLDLDTPSGRVRFEIAATVVDFSDPAGVIYLARSVYKNGWRDPLITALGIQVASGTPPADVRDTIQTHFGDRGLMAASNQTILDQTMDYLDEIFAYTRAIEGAALVVGLIGLVNTVVIGIVARTREFAMFRAIGMSRHQLVETILLETTIVGVLASAVATILGVFISEVWVVNSLRGILGWYVEARVPWSGVFGTIVAGLVTGLLAGLWAVRRATSLEIRTALGLI